MAVYALSTKDNPYNPFFQWDQWYNFDVNHGYCCCSYLDRIAKTSEQFTDSENEREIERAIDEIIDLDFMNIYIKVPFDPNIKVTKLDLSKRIEKSKTNKQNNK